MTLAEMKQRLSDIRDEIEPLMQARKDGTCTAEDVDKIIALGEERDDLKAKIAAEEKADAVIAGVVVDDVPAGIPPVAGLLIRGPTAEQQPYSDGEILRDMVVQSRAATHNTQLPMARLDNYQASIRDEWVINAAATGSNETIPSEGGYLVGTDMGGRITERAYNNSELAPRTTRRTLSNNANSMKLNGVDETSRVDGSRHGGIRGYWLAEADDLTKSAPTWRQIEIELKKLGILYYATDELMQDTVTLEQEVEGGVSDELAFKLQDAIYAGDGAGKPLGILNSPCLVSQAKEAGQAADTILFENIVKMKARFWGRNGIWIHNADILPQLSVMNLAVGTGGVPVWLPAGGAADAQNDRLLGLPMVEIEQAPTVGTVGDIMLADMSQYLLGEKGGVQSAMSIHVQFVNDEIVFRWIIRVDGQPLWNAALTPYKGGSTKTRSPFVALASRD